MKVCIFSILSFFSTIAFAADIPMSEVAKHKTASDCWMAIDGKVYDVSKYIAQHKQDLDKVCGTDATKCYKEPKAGKTHSDSANKMMKYFFKGNLAK